jgi:hypothetical protein
MELIEKVRENRARRAAQRQGLHVVKSRRRDALAADFGTYAIVDGNNNLIAGDYNTGFGLSLDDVEMALNVGGRS